MKILHILPLIIASLILLETGNDLFAQWKVIADTNFAVSDTAFYQQYKDSTIKIGNRDTTVRIDAGLDTVLHRDIFTEPFGGALAISGNTVWAGSNGLWYSEDTGKIWRKNSLLLQSSEFIHDINFFDKANGLVATSGGEVMVTHDSGKTWGQILSTGSDLWKASFNGSIQVIHATGSEKGVCYTSTDGGNSWHESYLGPFVSCMAISSDHTVYVFAQKTYKFSGVGWN
jgi:photosystem II stability/assembly factor-like uncharacterized protein